MIDGTKVSLVLGGGGVKGLAHVGVLRALRACGIVPDEIVGTSVGAYIGALAAGGLLPDEVREVALSIRRRDVLDYDWFGMLWRRSGVRALYKGRAFHDMVRRTLPVDSFDKLLLPLYVTSVELDTGREVIWGMPGFTEIPLHDCVVASCSIPGLYPPKKISRFHFVDGSLVDSLPVKVSFYNGAGLVIAVYLDSDEARGEPCVLGGMGSILNQAQSILSRALVRHNLGYFDASRMVLIRPRVENVGFFDFGRADEVIRAGEEAAWAALLSHPLTRPMVPTPLRQPPKILAG